MNRGGIERRREVRYKASGPIEFTVRETVPVLFRGELVDISTGGFRARHERTNLSTGQEVHYSHSGGEGAAKVMWSRIQAGRVESGFLVL